MDERVVMATASILYQCAEVLDAVGTPPARDLASCIGILLLAVQDGEIEAVREELTEVADALHLHPGPREEQS